MQHANFSFRPEVTKEQQASMLDQIGRWEPVIKAAPLDPDAKHPSIRRMYHVYLTDDADATATVDCLSSLPEIESAAIPAPRYLILPRM